MVILGMIQDAATWLSGANHWIDIAQTMQGYLPHDLLVLDKPLEVDLFGDLQRAFNNFVRTGQIWAFLIGIVLGYLFKSFTSYG